MTNREASTLPSQAAGGGTSETERYRVRRFDADRTDQRLSFDEALASRPSARQLLWIDLTGEMSEADAKRVSDRFALEPRTRRSLASLSDRPHLGIHGEYVHIRVAAEPDDKKRGGTQWLDIVAGKNVVISRHSDRIAFLDEVDERIQSDTELGKLSSATFVASLLDATITSYHQAVDAIEDDVDALDAKSLRDVGRGDLLAELVDVRRRIARLRRLLTDHRALFASLASPDVGTFADDPDSAAALQAVSSRFQGAIAAVEDSREVLLGSFDIYMTRTAQRTNHVMKILALATVLLLPGSLAAGLLGMNVTVPLSKDDPLSFWVVVVAIAVFAVAIVTIARARRWL